MSKFLKVIGIIAVLLVIIGAAAYWFILKSSLLRQKTQQCTIKRESLKRLKIN